MEKIIVLDTKFEENESNRLWKVKTFKSRIEADEYFDCHYRPYDLIIKNDKDFQKKRKKHRAVMDEEVISALKNYYEGNLNLVSINIDLIKKLKFFNKHKIAKALKNKMLDDLELERRKDRKEYFNSVVKNGVARRIVNHECLKCGMVLDSFSIEHYFTKCGRCRVIRNVESKKNKIREQKEK